MQGSSNIAGNNVIAVYSQFPLDIVVLNSEVGIGGGIFVYVAGELYCHIGTIEFVTDEGQTMPPEERKILSENIAEQTYWFIISNQIRLKKDVRHD